MGTSRALLYKAGRQSRNQWHAILRQSRFKQLFVLSFAILFELLLMVIFRDAFRFLNAFGGAGLLMIGRLFALFFLGLGWMLAVSGIVTSYSTLFNANEIPFLLVKPVKIRSIAVYQFIQASSYSSWAFFFIIIPFIGAYTWHQQLSPLFLLWTFCFSIPFLFLFTGMGTLFVLLAVRWIPKPGKWRLLLIALLITSAIAVFWFRSRPIPDFTENQFNLATIIPGIRIAAHPLSPSYWISEGIMALTRGYYGRGLLFFALINMTAIMMGLLIETIGACFYYDAWQKAKSSDRQRRRPLLLKNLTLLRCLIPADIAAMITKDIRTFFRDPVQWTQALVFFGLLLLYFSNLQLFDYDLLPEQWRSAITFLNVFAVAAVLSSLSSRFVYPQLSLEGHSFWMLGLSPATMPRIVAAKCILAFAATSGISLTLITISSRMLRTDPAINWAALAVIAAVCVVVSTMSTGLGAFYIDLEQTNPAAIVSSFGGTLNIVLCLVFMLAAIVPFGVVFHFREMGMLLPSHYQQWLMRSYAWLALITLLFSSIPLLAGIHALRKRDF